MNKIGGPDDVYDAELEELRRRILDAEAEQFWVEEPDDEETTGEKDGA